MSDWKSRAEPASVDTSDAPPDWRLRSEPVDEAKEKLDKENQEKIRKLMNPKIGEQLGYIAEDPIRRGATVLSEAARNAPVVGPLAESFADDVLTDEDKAAMEERRRDLYRHAPTVAAVAGTTGAIGGGLALPAPGQNTGGPAGILTRVGSTAGYASADAAMRGEDVPNAAATGLFYGMIPEAARIRNYNRVFGNIPDEVSDYYVKNRAAVNGAPEVKDAAAALNKDAKRVQKGVSQGSGESFDILKRSGQQYPLDNVLSAIDKARDKIKEAGAYGAGEKRLLKELDRLGYEIMGDSKDLANVPPEKVKSFIAQYRAITGAYERGKLGM